MGGGAKPLGCLSRLGDRSATGLIRDKNQGIKYWAYDNAARSHFMESFSTGVSYMYSSLFEVSL